MPLLPNKKILFIHIPKTGGTTIEAALGMQQSECFFAFRWYKNYKVCPQHLYYSEISKEVLDLKEYKSFTVVRNPFDRLVSEYYHTLSGVNKLTFPMFKDHCFRDFVKQSLNIEEEQRKKIFDRHLEPQHFFLEGCENMHVFRFEQIKQCFNFLKTLDSKVSFGHERKSFTRKKYQEYYDPETISLVTEFYSKDLEKFNYTFDP